MAKSLSGEVAVERRQIPFLMNMETYPPMHAWKTQLIVRLQTN